MARPGETISEFHRQQLISVGKTKVGSRNPNWKGGRIFCRGHVFIKSRDHPFHNSAGYVRESRLVMEKHLGRYLDPEEVVHHIDRDVLNNRIKNLELFTDKGSHISFHYTLRRKDNG